LTSPFYVAISISGLTLPDYTQIGLCRAKVIPDLSCSTIELPLIYFVEYAQALAFDQLKNLMANGLAFVGFQEATIDFPPTFKYDVLRTLSLHRRHRRHGSSRKHPEERAQRLESPDEKEPEHLEAEDMEEEAEGEAASMASTFASSMHSKAGTDRDIDDDYFHASPSSQTMSTSNSKASVVAEKAKVKLMSLISPLSAAAVTSPTKLLRSKHKVMYAAHSSVDLTSDAVSAHLLPPGQSSSLEAVDRANLRPPPMIFVSSTKSTLPSDDEDGDGKVVYGVYDSSHKKRVPSWYVSIVMSGCSEIHDHLRIRLGATEYYGNPL
jgi:hypothetical protein